MLRSNYDKSIELISQFIIKEHDELMNIIDKRKKMSMKGPTFDEYLGMLQSNLEKNIKNYDKKWQKKNWLFYYFR
jgi:hypothetical protein